MKNLFFIYLAICLCVISCKKDTSKKSVINNVTFKFYPGSHPSTILITNLLTGDIKKYDNQKDSLIINTTVNIGDKIQPEMMGNMSFADDRYIISVYANGKLIAKDGVHGPSNDGNYDVKILVTFTANNFK
ncbi:hypothetical protein [Mucilaginibacter xinganensis]|nr:hypothetical protein [Mucilaginibacter xinganensis]